MIKMITRNELRIGNMVKVKDTALHAEGGCVSNTYFEIEEIKEHVVQFKGFHAGEYYKDLEPIDLTENLLLMCGFKFSDHYTAYEHIDLCVVVKKNDGNGYWRLDPFEKVHDGKLYITSESEYTVSEKPIEYLHQLQNVFYVLTGKELEFQHNKDN